MKRALVIAVSAALFTTLFGGFAAAESSSDRSAGYDDPVARVQDRIDVDGHSIWRRCRRLFGDDELTTAAKEKCLQLWKRWCNAHPHARHCPRPDPPPPCRISDRVTDRVCIPHPCLSPDQIHDRVCIPDPCRVTDAAVDRVCVPHPCKRADGIVRCVPIPTDRPTDLPVVGPDTRPKDDVFERPTDLDQPADTRPKDRIPDRSVNRLTDREGNDVHLRTVDADS